MKQVFLVTRDDYLKQCFFGALMFYLRVGPQFFREIPNMTYYTIAVWIA